jgi:plasmid stability protein
MDGKEVKKLTVSISVRNVPADLWREARIQAAREDTSASEIVIKALAEYVQKRKSEQ